MRKTILVTGSTDGIGLETAKMLIKREQHVIIHGRNIE
ncbi:SDR family NAD(P)-dependent oxidoreductase, partial [Vibrio parahaemolyticus]